MNFISNIFVICTFVSGLVIGDVFGLNERSVLEKRCHGIHPDPAENIDYDWVQSVDTWYWPHANKLHAFRVASEVKKTPIEDIKDHHYYHNSCMIVKWGKRTVPIIYGFDGQKVNVTITPVSYGIVRFNFDGTDISGTLTVTMTDNKTYQFFYGCWDDGEASWAVLSITKVLDDKTEDIIFDHAISLGFKDEHFTEHQYETCEDIIEDEVEGKDEL